MTELFNTVVAGITKKSPNGVNIQTTLKNYVTDNYDTNRFDKDDYDYWTNDEIEDFEFEVYQYELYEPGAIALVPNPDNPYDSNAIMVIHKHMGMIGYIPREDNVGLSKILDQYGDSISVDMKLEGGPFKYYDLYSDKVKKENKPYYIRLLVKSSNDNHQSVNIEQKSGRSTSKLNTRSSNSYDLFEQLAMDAYNYPDNNGEATNLSQDIKQSIKTDNKSNNVKDPKIYLVTGLISIILFILSVILRQFLVSLIPLVIGLMLLFIYKDIKS